MEYTSGQHILVFLPQAAAALIAARLSEIGYLTSVACSVPELHKALISGDHRLVVTTRPDIDTVRDIKALPVLNLEIFFHPDPHGTSVEVGTKQFDARAFLSRVRMLTDPARAKDKPLIAKNSTPAEGRGRWLPRLFGIVQLNAAKPSS
ncbi:hypothetical protein C8J36_1085 [Rhizobium sp. PP-F2F-G48]|uniref:hypothetical protein n=1 Tax=Rhizobium sp. PP-F2F-G48 TaxID=2135651 RepID=UPI00104AC862|nr:hypothetical protein [Rhizobium sp. PP-F2F-G48]TCM52561.1 hypothetical protein C8J36_1085 [Rhizobium sp. PP-F2F-G48]